MDAEMFGPWDRPWFITSLLELCGWELRLQHGPLLTQCWRAYCNSEPHWRVMCQRIALEHDLYSPPVPPPGITFASVFRRNLWPLRSMWHSDFTPSTESTNIVVTAKFRPHKSGATEAQLGGGGKRFFLPLHQQLQLIQARDRCGRKAAIQALHAEKGWFQGRAAAASGDDSIQWGDDSIADAPCGKEEEDDDEENKENGGSLRQHTAHVQSVDQGTGRVVMVAKGVGLRPFAFDHALGAGCEQPESFEKISRGLVSDFLNGISASIIMYGQTGSGKTHTCFGPPGVSATTDPDAPEHRQRGLVPRACEEVLRAVAARRASGLETELSASYIEVYGNEVTDLLSGGASVGHNKVSAQRYVLTGEARHPVESLADLQAALKAGDEQKRRAATAMNERSSRAHSLFILSLRMSRAGVEAASGGDGSPAGTVVVTSQLFLVDLGGSEQVKRSNVGDGGVMTEHHGYVVGDRMREAISINLGLLALKRCIEALNRKAREDAAAVRLSAAADEEGGEHPVLEGGGGAGGDAEPGGGGNRAAVYVPYQDSKLTMLLTPALGGNAKCAVVVCASLEDSNAAETMQALKFGEQCSNVENVSGRNVSGVTAILEALTAEMSVLEDEIKSKERWETREVVRQDTLLEEGTFEAAQAAQHGGEVVRVGVVVGAEQQRERLETLIRQRAELTGESVDLRLAEAGFGGMYGGKSDALGGHASQRFKAEDGGLVVKGRRVAQWQT